MARATLAQLEEREKELRRRIAAAKKAQAESARKERTHALIVMGSMVERCIPGGWEAVDWDGLDAYLTQYGQAVAGRCTGDPLDAKDAAARLREWERERRSRGQAGEYGEGM